MAIGDIAQSAAGGSLPLVPDSGEEGKVRWGSRELNRTRDMIGQLRIATAQTRAQAREMAKISYGTSAPSGGSNGDIYFQLIVD